MGKKKKSNNQKQQQQKQVPAKQEEKKQAIEESEPPTNPKTSNTPKDETKSAQVSTITSVAVSTPSRSTISTSADDLLATPSANIASTAMLSPGAVSTPISSSSSSALTAPPSSSSVISTPQSADKEKWGQYGRNSLQFVLQTEDDEENKRKKAEQCQCAPWTVKAVTEGLSRQTGSSRPAVRLQQKDLVSLFKSHAKEEWLTPLESVLSTTLNAQQLTRMYEEYLANGRKCACLEWEQQEKQRLVDEVQERARARRAFLEEQQYEAEKKESEIEHQHAPQTASQSQSITSASFSSSSSSSASELVSQHLEVDPLSLQQHFFSTPSSSSSSTTSVSSALASASQKDDKLPTFEAQPLLSTPLAKKKAVRSPNKQMDKAKGSLPLNNEVEGQEEEEGQTTEGALVYATPSRSPPSSLSSSSISVVSSTASLTLSTPSSFASLSVSTAASSSSLFSSPSAPTFSSSSASAFAHPPFSSSSTTASTSSSLPSSQQLPPMGAQSPPKGSLPESQQPQQEADKVVNMSGFTVHIIDRTKCASYIDSQNQNSAPLMADSVFPSSTVTSSASASVSSSSSSFLASSSISSLASSSSASDAGFTSVASSSSSCAFSFASDTADNSTSLTVSSRESVEDSVRAHADATVAQLSAPSTSYSGSRIACFVIGGVAIAAVGYAVWKWWNNRKKHN
eukprot:TRINITY_DN4631_c0_g1_i1.p1 TRINITY_DN4631_c0_g1~~TRINITY_DN4631_c0_g1_i1.p1  ORF type:complete len:683 (+),score=318.58 TRINITY_DN4631_c0_g1_i1:61-2109(+)